jgi:hypothetical protein
MTRNGRAFRLWIDVIGFVLPLLTFLAVVLEWSPTVQLLLTILMVGAILGTELVVTGGRRWRLVRRIRAPRLRS